MFRDIKKPAVLVEAAGFLLSIPSSDILAALRRSGASLGACLLPIGQECPQNAETRTTLTQLQVRNARPKEKPYRFFDGGGLYLEVTPTGSKLWRMKFRQPGRKENRLSFGVFPEVSLADARARRDQARKLLASGADPARARDERARRASDVQAKGNIVQEGIVVFK